MKRESMVINIRDIIEYLWLKKKSIVACTVVVMLLATCIGGVKGYKDYKANNGENTGVTVNTLEDMKKQMNQDDVTYVEASAESYQKYDLQLEQLESYFEQSILMSIDASKTPTLYLSYHVVDQGDGKKAVTFVENLKKNVADEVLCNQISTKTGYAGEYVSELISAGFSEGQTILSQNGSQALSIQIVAPDKDQLPVIAECVDETIRDLAKSMGIALEDKNQRTVTEANNRLIQARESKIESMIKARNQMTAIRSGLEDQKLALFNAIRNGRGETVTTQTAVALGVKDFVRIKYVALGFVGGLFLALFVYLCLFLFSGKLRAAEDIVWGYNSLQIGQLVNTKSKVNTMDRVATEIRAIISNVDKHKIAITSSVEDEKMMQELMRNLENELTQKKVDAIIVPAIANEKNHLEQLETTDAIIFVERLMATKYSDLDKMYSICNNMNIPVLGCVIAK